MTFLVKDNFLTSYAIASPWPSVAGLYKVLGCYDVLWFSQPDRAILDQNRREMTHFKTWREANDYFRNAKDSRYSDNEKPIMNFHDGDIVEIIVMEVYHES